MYIYIYVILLHVAVQYSQCHLLKKLSFPHCIFCQVVPIYIYTHTSLSIYIKVLESGFEPRSPQL